MNEECNVERNPDELARIVDELREKKEDIRDDIIALKRELDISNI